MSNSNQNLLCFLLIFVLHFTNLSAQGPLPTGDVFHVSDDFPLSPITYTGLENSDDPSYFEVEFNSEEVLNSFYGSIPTDPPDYDTQMRYFWTFGDGHISYESNPVHQYAVGGTYEVTFQATPIYTPKPPPPLMTLELTAPEGFNGELDVTASAGTPSSNSGRMYIQAEMLRSFRSNYESSMIITYFNDSEEIENDEIQVYYDSEKVDAVALYSFQGESVEYAGDIMTASELAPELSTDGHKMLSISFTNLLDQETRRIMIQFVSKNPLEVFDPNIFFGVNFQNHNITEVPLIQTALRKSWDPNSKEVFEDYISPLDIPNTVKYRIFMENIGPAPTSTISVLDRVHSVLNIDADSHAIVRSKDNSIEWEYQPNLDDYNVNYYASNIYLAGQSPEYNIEDSKFWFDVEYELDIPRLEEKITISNGHCRNGLYSFGRNAKITFDSNPPINTNTPIVKVGCPKEDIAQCLAIKDIYPNPVFNTGTLTYKVAETLRKPLDVFVTSKHGNVVQIASNLSATKGVHSYTLDFTGLNPDIYQLIVANKYCTAKIKGFVKK